MVPLAKKHSSPSPLKVLGELEREIMEVIWRKKTATVRDVYEDVRKRRKIAYTTVMTIMDRLFAKEIVKRKKEGKTYRYSARQSKESFFEKTSQQIISGLLKNFGEVAIAQFANTLDRVDPKRLKSLREKIKARK